MTIKKNVRAGRPCVTSREEILAMADTLFREGGESGFSFRKLAERLNMTAPGIYTYFSNKQEILQALIENVLMLPKVEAQEKRPVKQLHDFLCQLRQQILKAQHLIFLFGHILPVHPMLKMLGQIAHLVEAAGVPPEQAKRHGQSLLWMVLGFVIFEVNSLDEAVLTKVIQATEYQPLLEHLDLYDYECLWQETLERNLLFMRELP